MKIKIAYLYYDLMNLYGENANVRALSHGFENQNIEVDILYLTIKDKIDFNKYDIYYMGMGSEESELLVLKDLLKYKNDIKRSIENNKYFFMTGNSFELFGKCLIDFDNNRVKCLDIFNYYTKLTNILNLKSASKFRIVGEVEGTTNIIDKKIIGFQNRSGVIYDNSNPLFKITKGTGDKPKDNNEGFIYKNFLGTHLIGPLFIRNPYLLNYFIKKILLENNIKYTNYKNSCEINAYNEYIKNFSK